MAKRKIAKRQRLIYTIQQWKVNIEQHEPQYKPGVNLGAMER